MKISLSEMNRGRSSSTTSDPNSNGRAAFRDPGNGTEDEGSEGDLKEERSEADKRWISRIFKATFLMQVLLNFDSGCIPASLVQMDRELGLSFAQQGLMGGLVYLGLVITSLFGGSLLMHFSPKHVLFFACAINGAFCVVFAFAPSTLWLILARFGVGLSQAIHCIYAPVWVDQFAPLESQTVWMSLLQLSIPLGVMLGYAAGITTEEEDGKGGRLWRVPFIAQGFAIVCASFLILCIPGRLLTTNEEQLKAVASARKISTHMKSQRSLESNSIRRSSPRSNDVSPSRGLRSSNRSSIEILLDDPQVEEGTDLHGPERGCCAPVSDTCTGAKMILSSGVYATIVFGLTGLYFIVTGIQFWVTPFMVEELGFDLQEVGVGFVICSSTGPTLGVVLGGVYIDKLGGYSGSAKQTYIALKALFIPICIACSCCFLVIFFNGFYITFVLLWVVLFTGGMAVPASTGILISSVRSELRPFSSALSLMIFNIFGYFLAPVLSGFVMEATGSRTRGFQVIMCWSGVVLTFYLGGMWFGRKAARAEGQRIIIESSSSPKNRGSAKPPSLKLSNGRAVSESFDSGGTDSPIGSHLFEHEFDDLDNNSSKGLNGHARRPYRTSEKQSQKKDTRKSSKRQSEKEEDLVLFSERIVLALDDDDADEEDHDEVDVEPNSASLRFSENLIDV